MDILITVLVIAGWLALFIGSRRMLKRECAELRFEFQHQIDSLSAKVKDLVETVGTRTVAVAPGKTKASAASSAAELQIPATDASGEITPETLATISNTVTALLGRKVHISSVKILETPNVMANPWAQHGRAVVQASRNFASRRREP